VSAIAREVVERLGKRRAELVANGDRNTLIFPNLVINDIMAITVRTFYPVRADYMEINAWALAPIGESKTSRERRLRNFLEFLGPAGFASPDDVDVGAVPKGLRKPHRDGVERHLEGNAEGRADEQRRRANAHILATLARSDGTGRSGDARPIDRAIELRRRVSRDLRKGGSSRLTKGATSIGQTL
jgi:hypothetical protein